MMRRLLTAPALAAHLLLPPLVRADDPPKGDKDLDGTWELVSSVQDGKEFELPKDGKLVVTIKGSSFTAKVGDEAHTETISVDASKAPRTIDMTSADGPQKGKAIKGVYEVKGDELRICHASLPDADRPKELASKEGSGLALVTFKRVKQ